MAGRGQSSVRMWKKAALTRPVEPTVGKDGVKQPAYMRSHSAAQTSRNLKAYQAFMRKCMSGHHYSGRLAVQKAFAKCAKRWKGKNTSAADYDFDESQNDDELFWE